MKRRGGLESSRTGPACSPWAPRPVQGCRDLQSLAFMGLNELILSGLRLINPAAGCTQGATWDISSPCVGKVHCPGPNCCFVCVLSAEKVTSLGKDWHRPCLRCAKCNKTLSSGSHAEVRKHRLSAPGHRIRASPLRTKGHCCLGNRDCMFLFYCDFVSGGEPSEALKCSAVLAETRFVATNKNYNFGRQA